MTFDLWVKYFGGAITRCGGIQDPGEQMGRVARLVGGTPVVSSSNQTQPPVSLCLISRALYESK